MDGDTRPNATCSLARHPAGLRQGEEPAAGAANDSSVSPAAAAPVWSAA
jgi:hypothetical protein